MHLAALPHQDGEHPVLAQADKLDAMEHGCVGARRDNDARVPRERMQDAAGLAQHLFQRAGCRYLILKLGERGSLTYRSPGPLPREFFVVESFVHQLVDPVGAGDALLAMATLALARAGDIVVASLLGSLAAAVACEHPGNTPVTVEEVDAKLDALERAAGL